MVKLENLTECVLPQCVTKQECNDAISKVTIEFSALHNALLILPLCIAVLHLVYLAYKKEWEYSILLDLIVITFMTAALLNS